MCFSTRLAAQKMADKAMVLKMGLAEIRKIQHQQAHLSLVCMECKWATKQDADFEVYE